MRTTLKRGIGRAAGVDGNGRAVLPPAALTPMTRYRQPEPEPRSGVLLVGRIVLWLLAAVLMLVVALVAGYYLFTKQSLEAISARSPDVIRAQKILDVPLPGAAAIALIIGYDHRANEAANQPSRSDTIMLLRADPVTKSISMLSFPRDLQVNVECPGKLTFVGKINAAYTECGSRGTLKTVKDLTGLPVNFLITVDFHGFKEIVDKVGGVWLDIDRRYFNNNAGVSQGNTYATINLGPGYQKLTGGAALDFVRYRHTDSDLFRVARQQEFVRALKEQIKHSFLPLSLPKILNAMTHSVEVGQAGGKSLEPGTVYSYAKFAYELPPGHFFQARIGGLSGYSNLTTETSNIAQAVQDFTSPDVSAPKVATAVALGQKIRSSVPKPAHTSITVLNGNGQAGSAANAGYLLGQRGYRIFTPPNGATGNAPSFNYNNTTVYFDPAQPGAQAAAKQVANVFAPADTARMAPEVAPLANGAMLVVVVGQTFHNTIGPAPVVTTPTRQPPRVVSNPTVMLAQLKAVRGKVAFRMEVPTVIEQTSIPDPEKPLRVYFIQGSHKALRLTFRTGGREYWGIEETDWTGAPALDDRNFRHVLGGREFDLYYSGSHLHMVVLRENGATYWVVNTLLDSLTNETMLAIAKGLRPLPRR